MDDYEAIRQLTARYNRTFDDRDVDGWVDCFTPDGRFEFVDAGRVVEGHDALRALVTGSANTGRHTTTDFVITLDGDRAEQSCHLTELGRAGPTGDGGKGFEIRALGRYEDVLQRDAGAWRFRSRRLVYG